MSKVLHLTVRERKLDGESVFEGVAQLEGGTPFKLTKSRSTETRFTTRSSLTQSATNFAKRFGLELDIASAAKANKATRGNKNGTATRSTTKRTRSQPTSLASDTVIV